jgi:hypothetical protein
MKKNNVGYFISTDRTSSAVSNIKKKYNFLSRWILIFIFIFFISCNKKGQYNSTIYSIDTNDSTKVEIEYDTINEIINFNFNNKIFEGQISNDTTLVFSQKNATSKKIEVDNDNMSFHINIDGVRYYVYGTNQNSKKINSKINDSIKLKIKTEIINAKTIDEREKLTSKEFEDYLILESSDNFGWNINGNEIFKNGDIVVLFNDYYDDVKLNNFPLYYTKDAIKLKKPLLVVFHSFEGIMTGNRFRDGGLNANQVGYTYSYGNYETEVKFLRAHFVYFNYRFVKLSLDNYIYLYYFENNSSQWVKSYEGLCNFNAKENYEDEMDNIFFKEKIVDIIFSNNKKYKTGVVKNNKVIWNNNYNNIKSVYQNLINTKINIKSSEPIKQAAPKPI